jgi:opacity protein-like surface antigen
MRPRPFHACLVPVTLALLLCPASASAQGQSFGLGGRFSLMRGDVQLETAATRLAGGLLRARVSKRLAFELALDYRSETNDTLTERVREYPLQASLLLYPVQGPLAPYLLGGAGWYSQRVDLLGDGDILDTTTTRLFGYHAGLGGELRLGRHAALHADYRYTFIRFGAEDTGEGEPGAVPIPGTIGLQDRLRLSHQGSMWTGGLTFYF